MKVSLEEKEKKILESARKFFFRYGFKKTSMDEIAEDAGISKGSLYNYFKNKEDLFIQVGECKQKETFEKVLKQKKGLERADAIMIHYVLYMVQDVNEMVKEYAMSKMVLEELMLVGMDLMGDHPDHIAQSIELIQEGIDQGIFKPGDNMKRAFLLNQIIKVFFLRWVRMDQQEAETEIRDIHELIFDGLRN